MFTRNRTRIQRAVSPNLYPDTPNLRGDLRVQTSLEPRNNKKKTGRGRHQCTLRIQTNAKEKTLELPVSIYRLVPSNGCRGENNTINNIYYVSPKKGGIKKHTNEKAETNPIRENLRQAPVSRGGGKERHLTREQGRAGLVQKVAGG